MIVSSALHWTGSTGSVSRKEAEYTAVWRLRTDNPQDQAQTVLLWFQLNVLSLGTPYAYAGDTALSVATAQRIRAQRVLTTVDSWDVVVQYGTETEDQGLDDDGEPTSDPLDFRPRISSRTAQYTRPVERAIYKSGFTGTAATLVAPGTSIIPCNSAMIPYDPPLEMEDARISVQVQRNLATYDATEDDFFANAINSQAFRLQKYGYKIDVEPYTAKLRDNQVGFRRQNGIDFWEVSWQFDIDRFEWIDEVVDRGVIARACDGDPDGRGGTIGQQVSVPAGLPHARRLTDFEERPLPDPVLFDGDGKPLAICPGPVTPVYLRYGKYTEWNFLSIPFFQGILEAL